jgi:LacI family transcriptional regulator
MVAEKSGFSLATVSYVISGRKQFPLETVDAIRKVANDLGYPFGQSRNALPLIGLCFILQESTFHEDIYFLEMMEGVLDCCTKNGYRMILSKIFVDDSISSESYEGLLDAVQGVVLCNPRQDHRFEEDIIKRKLPYVVLGTTENSETSFNVDVDMKAAGYQCTDYLLKEGRRNIFFINLNEHMLQSKQRLEGFRFGMASNGIAWNDKKHVFLPATMEDSYRIVSSLLEGPQEYDAIVTSNEIQGHGTLKALLDHAIAVPQDIAVLSMGGTVLSQLGRPQLTTMDFDPHKNGYEAANLLFEVLQKKRLSDFHLILPGTLIKRDST